MEKMPGRLCSKLSPVVAMSILGMMLRLAAAAQYAVGDDRGWTTNVNFTKWTSQHTFYEGDSIVFSYPRGAHDVLRVSSVDYESCRISNPIETDNSGQTTFGLQEGRYYFICGFPGHCAESQKVFLKVEPPPSSTLNPPSYPNGDVPGYSQGAEGPSAYGPSGAFQEGAAPVTTRPSLLHSLLVLIFGCIVASCASVL